MLSFNDIRNRSQKSEKRYKGVLLTFDPGHTTGYSVWQCSEDAVNIIDTGQVPTWANEDLQITEVSRLFEKYKPNTVVMESYQIYEWKADDHSWSQIPTIQVIGCIKTLCIQLNIPYFSQTAQVAKQFCTDPKLESWGFFVKGKRHARDAIRHGCYYLLFGFKG